MNSLRNWWNKITDAVAVGCAVIAVGGLSLAFFAVPAVAASQVDARPGAFVVGLLFLGLIGVVVFLFALDAAARIYGFRRPWLVPKSSYNRTHIRFGSPTTTEPAAAMVSVAISYAFALYAFAVIFTAISVRDTHAFSEPLNIGTAAYFSVITAATVGFGDIHPVSGLARFAVTVQVLFSFAYVLLLLSVVAGLAWRGPKRDGPTDHVRRKPTSAERQPEAPPGKS